MAFHLVRQAGQAAFSGSEVDKVSRGVNQISCHEVVVLVAQMRLRRFCLGPNAVTIELAPRVFDKAEQGIDFLLDLDRGSAWAAEAKGIQESGPLPP